jgi:uncharacterized protein YciI
MIATLPLVLLSLFAAPASAPTAAAKAAPAAGVAALPMPEMTTYRFGLLRRGPAWSAERTPRTDSLQAGHMANMGRMHAMGKLIAAGPFRDGGDFRGIFIFRADSLAEVRTLAAADPAIAAGRLRLDAWDWMAPVGIGRRYAEMAARPGHQDSMVTVTFGVLRKGPNYVADASPALETMMGGHLQHILRGLASGQVLSAGPLADAGDWAGLMFFPMGVDEARAYSAADPAVAAGHFALDLYTLWIADGALR